MNQKWNLQDIKPAQPRKKRAADQEVSLTKKHAPVESPREEADDVMSINVIDGNKKKNRSLLLAIIIFLLVIGSGIVASMLMAGAEVTVYPRYRDPNVNAIFEAMREPQPEELAYEIMNLEESGERQVTASGQEHVTKQSEGTILIYNKHQSSPVRLVTNTRFESNGLTFRIKDSVVIPGYTTDAEGNIAPGVMTAEVFADQPGEQYNLGPARFTIPGFAGEPEFDDVYAESIETFSGGFDGQRFIIEENELQKAQQALRTELRNALLEKIDANKPAGFTLFKDAVTFTYESLPAVEYGDDLATIKEKVIMQIPMFKDSNFAMFIAQATIPGYEGEPVRITDPSIMQFAYTSATTSSSDISQVDKLSFKLAGRPQIVWKYDSEKLKADLANANKTALPSILGGYPAIEKAEAVIRPFWKTKFPIKLDQIDIIEIIQ